MKTSLDKSLLKRLYREMLRIRMVEEKIAELYPEQEMRCPVHLCTGQEAVAVGVCVNLTRNDYVFSSHRSHGHYLAKGGDLNALWAELYGKSTGCSGGKGGSMHLVDQECGFLGSTPIVGSTIPIAVGAAFGSILKGKSRVVVAFFGDAAVEEGVFHESANFAVLKKLPVVFVCENNLYSVYSPMSVRQSQDRPITSLAKGHGLTTYEGNGNDVLEVFKMAGEAVQSARNGRSPVFLEFSTYRWREHCGPYYDNQLGYRTEEEFLQWKNRCPVATFKTKLVKEGVLTEKESLEIDRELKGEIETAVSFAKQSPFPSEDKLFQDIYAP